MKKENLTEGLAFVRLYRNVKPVIITKCNEYRKLNDSLWKSKKVKMQRFGDKALNLAVAMIAIFPLELLVLPFILLWKWISNAIRVVKN